MKVEVGKTYLDGEGSKVEIYRQLTTPNDKLLGYFMGEFVDRGDCLMYDVMGKLMISGDSESSFNLVSEYQEPKEATLWVNLYEFSGGYCGTAHQTEDDALRHGILNRIGVEKVTFKL